MRFVDSRCARGNGEKAESDQTSHFLVTEYECSLAILLLTITTDRTGNLAPIRVLGWIHLAR